MGNSRQVDNYQAVDLQNIPHQIKMGVSMGV
jgi:hypothetical protein